MSPFTVGRLTVLLLLLLASLSGCGSDTDQSSADRDSATDQDSVVIALDGEDSVSVFEILTREHEVDFESSAMGVFVRAIDSIEGGDGYYWFYAVNDTMGQTAADKRITATGDRVTWHLRRVE
ncbi:DUF4430 domain-containing protein [candidate division GN15 bacterium]|nr:DUF4430 domain-containing protein [candidate division GN15 bacterium]